MSSMSEDTDDDGNRNQVTWLEGYRRNDSIVVDASRLRAES